MKISWITINQLEKVFGNSFYILDYDKFGENYNEFLKYFQNIYPNTNIAYSYKTNYIPELCKYVNAQDGYAEVVSSMEFELALAVGVNPPKIIFNGPYKTKENLEKALLLGSIINIDSYDEFLRIKKIADNHRMKNLNIGIRCNFNVDSSELSRFGLDINGLEFEKIIKTVNKLENLSIIGLHSHFITKRRSTNDYVKISNTMIDLYYNLKNRNINLKFIDIGGGFYSKMDKSLKKQFTFSIPSYKDYADSIANLFLNRFSDMKNSPELILEPGIALTANALKFIAKILTIKKNNNKIIAGCSGSIYNIKPTLNEVNLPINVIKQDQKSIFKKQLVDITGYTCMENDYLYKNYEGNIEKDDFIIFDNVGAYTLVLKPPFILPNVPVIILEENSPLKYKIIKRKEEFNDIFATYKL